MSSCEPPEELGDRAAAQRITAVVSIVVWIQAAALIVFAILDLADLAVSRFALGLGGALMLGCYGVALGYAAWKFLRWREWTRGLIVFTQLVILGLAWNVRSADPVWLAPVLAVIAAGVLVGVFARPVTRAFAVNKPV